MGVTASSSHVVSAAPSSSGTGLLTFFPCSSVRSLSWETVLHKLPQRGSPTGSQALPANLLRRRLLSPLVCRSQQEFAPVPAPHGFTASFTHPPALAWGPFHGLQVDICSTMDLHGLQGDNLLHHGLQHELQGKTLCSGVSSTSFPLLLH